ncbi:hypothetical protein BAUCODRAFT_36715 [Baudoinia panamericana UAMH 10762]|uniref:Uncharacterized protein n=1 Tax=Baudoinia panamericana (strain UAMH 10762) TaxID=717646 RepID=M2N633_BAUPA|nr:uncharacterized protein BAUCODRAFT_36715 [Baudoinia panamericana UAMH 10762]EMC94245.1 hypothetical protein BAUCODRAFT_36715 [Baudoinia panamericana UAMH 10762]
MGECTEIVSRRCTWIPDPRLALTICSSRFELLRAIIGWTASDERHPTALDDRN